MRYKLLGNSGLRVSEIALGTMTFGEDWGFGASADECRKQLELFAERGGNFIDTANKYTNGSSEKIVGELVRECRERWVVATKYTLSMRDNDPNASGNHRKNLVQSVEGSLRRLGVDYIDLLWVHAWDFTTAPQQVMRALDDLIRLGKVLHVGVSDAPAWMVARANTLAELRGWESFAALQVEYSLIERTVERELLPMAKHFGMAVTPWAPLGGGVLTGKYTRNASPADSARAKLNGERRNERNLAIAKEVDAVADELCRSSAQVALNWVRQQGDEIIPLVGARTAAQLEDTLACLDFQLEQKHLERLSAASAIDLGFPHEFMGREQIRQIVYGDLEDRIDRR